MKIDVSSIVGIKAASLDFEFQVPKLPLVYPFALSGFVEPVEVYGKVTNTGKYLLVQGRINTKLAVACDRCLAPFEYPVDLEFEVEFQKLQETASGDEPGGDLPISDEDGVIYNYEGTILDLTKAVEDELSVGLPMKMICSDECQGLCPHCGQNLNERQCDCTDEDIDPRMEALRGLLTKEDQ